MRVLVLVAIAMCPSAAVADDATDAVDDYYDDDSLFVAGGPLLGGSLHDGPNGLLVGGELSAGWLHLKTSGGSKPVWLGAYVDGLYDTGSDTGRVSFGPELGFIIFGLDGGLVRELGDPGRWGLTGRVAFSIPVMWNDRTKRPRLTTVTTLSLYLRTVSWRDDSAGHREIGVLVKWALPALARW